MYLRKWVPLDFRSAYRQFENSEKAIKYYWEAYDYMDDDLAAFSVAQAMEDVGPSEWRRTNPRELYEKAMRALKRRIAEDHDHLFSVMLYYMLAICAYKLENSEERPIVFLSQARHSLRQVPTHVTCFSPINKIRLNRSQILEELEKFERTLARL
jgi:tetratricopeptide (TPR) repeat protein